MKKLSVKPKNWLVSFHVASGGIWLGTALCIVVVAITKKHTKWRRALWYQLSIKVYG